MANTSAIGIIAGAALFLVALVRYLRPYQDPREPPVARSPFSIFGHAFGMLRHQVFYYRMMRYMNEQYLIDPANPRSRDQTGSPIFTIPMPGSKLYIVSEPSLITPVQKQIKTLAFAPVVAKFSTRITGCSKEAFKLINTN